VATTITIVPFHTTIITRQENGRSYYYHGVSFLNEKNNTFSVFELEQ